MEDGDIKSIGVIGLGNFGGFAAGILAKDKSLHVVAYDPRDTEVPGGVEKTSFQETASADVVILCVPLSEYRSVLPKVRPIITPETLVADICSVKVEAERRVRELLPGHINLLITHPMFGSLSAANGTEGHTLVVTYVGGKRAQQAVEYCQDKLGLKIMRMTNEEHDKSMADVHALTFFVARGLNRANLAKSPFQAPSFQMLLDLVDFDKAHSEDLFRTIQLGNPFSAQVRRRLIAALKKVDDELNKENL